MLLTTAQEVYNRAIHDFPPAARLATMILNGIVKQDDGAIDDSVESITIAALRSRHLRSSAPLTNPQQ
jgi:hypothetical protein